MYNKNIIQKGRFVNRDVLVIGIDIGKSIHAAVGTSLESGFTKPYYIKNNRGSFEVFERIMEEWKERFDCKDILIGFESTGHYWKPLAYYLKGKGQFLVEVSTNNTKKSKEMMDNSPLKCDRKDSMVIADLVKQGKILSLREIIHTRENLIKERISILNRLEKIMDITFPERREVIKKVGNKTSLFLLNEAPFPENILRKGLNWLRRRMWEKSHGHYNHLDAEMLYESAKETIGIKEGREGSVYELWSLLPRLEGLNREIEEIESRIEEMLDGIEESRYISSMKGIGMMTTAAIISESGGLSRYDRAESVVKVAGLSLYEVSSGKHKGEKRITKRGRSLMRHKLYFAAIQQARKGMPLYSFYKRLIDNGVKKIKALIAVAIKLLKIMFALVRDKREFEWDYKRAKKVSAVA